MENDDANPFSCQSLPLIEYATDRRGTFQNIQKKFSSALEAALKDVLLASAITEEFNYRIITIIQQLYERFNRVVVYSRQSDGDTNFALDHGYGQDHTLETEYATCFLFKGGQANHNNIRLIWTPTSADRIL